MPDQQRQQRGDGQRRAARHQRPRATAAASSAAEKATPSHSGGVGMRQCGSMAACQPTTRAKATAATPAIFATHAQPVKTATNPTGTARPISGTTKALAERPEKPDAVEVDHHGKRQPQLESRRR